MPAKAAPPVAAKAAPGPAGGQVLRAVPASGVPAPAAPGALPEPAAGKALPDKSLPDKSGGDNKVVHIVRGLQEAAAQGRVRRKSHWLALSLLLAIALPTLLAALYFGFVAADRYVSEARFAVRSNEAQMADSLGMLTGMPAATVVSDSYIVSDYVRSREMVEALEQRLPLRSIYAHPAADWFSRLAPEATLEELVAYWDGQVDVYYDSTKNTIAVEVQAFAADDAQRLAAAVVEVVRSLVNDLSGQARRDAVRFAAAEVARAELRVRGARADILRFRTEHNDLDPTESAAASLKIAAELEGERSKLASQLASVAGYLSDTAPQVQMLKARIRAMEGEIAGIQGQVSRGRRPASPPAANSADAGADPIGGLAAEPAAPADRLAGPGMDPTAPGAAPGANADAGAPEAMATTVGRYGELLIDQEFAEKAYAAAQGSLERARAEADRTQSYLALYVNPRTAETAAYPRRILNILIVLALATILWAVGALATLTIRDHM